MSNLHLLLDEANKHDPKGFIPAAINTFPWKDELGLSTYREQMELPKAISFVDGALAPPSTADGDIFVPITGGALDAGWGASSSNDWVSFTNSIPSQITPLDGYLCYDVTGASWMEYSAGVWAAFGAGGTDTNLANTNLTLTDPARTYDILGNELQFKAGSNNRIRITANGVGIGNIGIAPAGTSLIVASTGATAGTTIATFENSVGLKALELKGDGSATFNSDVNMGVLPPAGSARLTVDAPTGVCAYFKDSIRNLVRIGTQAGMGEGSVQIYGGSSRSINLNVSAVSYFDIGSPVVIAGTTGNAALNIHAKDTTNVCKMYDVNGAIAYKFGSQTNLNNFQVSNYGGATIQHLFQSNGNDSYVNGTTTSNFGVGTNTPAAKLHIVGTIRSDQTTAVGKTISTDFLPINVNGTVRWLALYD